MWPRNLTIIAAMMTVCMWVWSPALAEKPDSEKNPWLQLSSENLSMPMPVITVVYDNNPHGERMETGWGFSCLIKGMEKTILFDTGGDGRRLLANMRKMGIAPQEIDTVVISHLHGDHVGGLESLMEENPSI